MSVKGLILIIALSTVPFFLSLISPPTVCTQCILGSILRRETELAVINHSFQYRYGYGQVNIRTILITVRACQGIVCRVHRATYRFTQRAFPGCNYCLQVCAVFIRCGCVQPSTYTSLHIDTKTI